MAPGKSNVLAFRRPGWSATADLGVPTARATRRTHGRRMLSLVESASQLDAAATLPTVGLADLRDELTRYRDLFEQAPVGFLVMDLTGRIECANRAATLALSPEHADLTGRYLHEFCVGDSARHLAEHVARLARGATFDLCEITLARSAESPLSLRVETINLGDGRPGPLRTVLLDTAGLDELEEGLSLAASVVEHTSQAVVVTDADYHAVAVNPAFTTVTGYTAAEVLGRVPDVFQQTGAISGRDHPLFAQLCSRGFWQGEFANRRKGGEPYLEWAQVDAIPDAQGNTKYYVCMLSDVSGQDAARNALIELAYRDSLTGLANRTSLLEQLGKALIAARRDKHPLGLIYLDLDCFKQVNDSLGHTGGDHLLQFIAERLRAAVRQTDLVARIGGDEFAIVMPHLTAEGAASRVAGNILAQLKTTHFREQGREYRIAVSIGITLFPKDGTTVETLLNCADSAMYEAKKAGGARYRFYSPQTSPDFKQHGELELELRHALTHRELQVQYRPRMRIRDLQVIGSEASARWDRAGSSGVDPRTLAALAETTGLVIPLQHWLMQTVAATAHTLCSPRPDRLRISFDIGMLHFDPDNLPHLLHRVTKTLTGDALIIELEVPEVIAASRSAQVQNALSRLRELGAEITLRGFGSEPLVLPQLASLPLDRVQLAPALVQALDTDPTAAAAVKGLCALARGLGLKVVADGVETTGQLRFLEEQGCDEAQGDLFSGPLSATAFAAILQQSAPAGAGSPAPPARPGGRLAAGAVRALARLRAAFRPASRAAPPAPSAPVTTQRP